MQYSHHAAPYCQLAQNYGVACSDGQQQQSVQAQHSADAKSSTNRRLTDVIAARPNSSTNRRLSDVIATRRKRLEFAEAFYYVSGMHWNSPTQQEQGCPTASKGKVNCHDSVNFAERQGLAKPSVSFHSQTQHRTDFQLHGDQPCNLKTQQKMSQKIVLEVDGWNRLPSTLDEQYPQLPQNRDLSSTTIYSVNAPFAKSVCTSAVPQMCVEDGDSIPSVEDHVTEKPFRFSTLTTSEQQNMPRSGPDTLSPAVQLYKKKEHLNEQIRRRQEAIEIAKQRLADSGEASQSLKTRYNAQESTYPATKIGMAGSEKTVACGDRLRFKSLDGSSDFDANSLVELIEKAKQKGATAEEVVEQTCSLFTKETPVLEKIIMARSNSSLIPR